MKLRSCCIASCALAAVDRCPPPAVCRGSGLGDEREHRRHRPTARHRPARLGGSEEAAGPMSCPSRTDIAPKPCFWTTRRPHRPPWPRRTAPGRPTPAAHRAMSRSPASPPGSRRRRYARRAARPLRTTPPRPGLCHRRSLRPTLRRRRSPPSTVPRWRPATGRPHPAFPGRPGTARPCRAGR